MNILSFDIEEWYIEKVFHGARQERYDMFERYLGEILDLLDKYKIKATFFVVGMMAADFPLVVRRIQERGHEIGCHSNCHTWLNRMDRKELYEDTFQAVNNLEQCVGQKIKCYRAPAFSIGQLNNWAFEVLAQCGIEYDASVFPAVRDFGGFADFSSQIPTLIRTKVGDIKEFPIVTTHLLGADLAFSGGGYFRFFPLWFVNYQIMKRRYNICYFHIGDLIPGSQKVMSKERYEEYFKEHGSLINRYKRHVKSNLGKKKAFDKMIKLIGSHDFMPIAQASKQIDWENCPMVEV